VITETIAAVNWLGAIGLKRHLCHLTAFVTGYHIQLTFLPVALSAEPALFTAAVFTSCPAGRTPGRLVGKTFPGIKFLFARSEFKFIAAIFTHQGFACKQKKHLLS